MKGGGRKEGRKKGVEGRRQEEEEEKRAGFLLLFSVSCLFSKSENWNSFNIIIAVNKTREKKSIPFIRRRGARRERGAGSERELKQTRGTKKKKNGVNENLLSLSF